jgi:hypothetical protein
MLLLGVVSCTSLAAGGAIYWITTPQESRARMDQVFGFLDAQLAAQTREVGWARDTEARISSTLANASRGEVRIRETSCAQTLCRIEASAASPEKAREFAGALGLELSFMSQKAIRRIDDGHGGTTVVAFLAREGSSLPTLPR